MKFTLSKPILVLASLSAVSQALPTPVFSPREIEPPANGGPDTPRTGNWNTGGPATVTQNPNTGGPAAVTQNRNTGGPATPDGDSGGNTAASPDTGGNTVPPPDWNNNAHAGNTGRPTERALPVPTVQPLINSSETQESESVDPVHMPQTSAYSNDGKGIHNGSAPDLLLRSDAGLPPTDPDISPTPLGMDVPIRNSERDIPIVKPSDAPVVTTPKTVTEEPATVTVAKPSNAPIVLHSAVFSDPTSTVVAMERRIPQPFPAIEFFGLKPPIQPGDNVELHIHVLIALSRPFVETFMTFHRKSWWFDSTRGHEPTVTVSLPDAGVKLQIVIRYHTGRCCSQASWNGQKVGRQIENTTADSKVNPIPVSDDIVHSRSGGGMVVLPRTRDDGETGITVNPDPTQAPDTPPVGGPTTVIVPDPTGAL
ncbi:hypothetical protein C8R43DRAFT_945188 [Mycena crocata]|nr:hypothetical protein C8R43DRAFT_945188 [Mycena crocata]